MAHDPVSRLMFQSVDLQHPLPACVSLDPEV